MADTDKGKTCRESGLEPSTHQLRDFTVTEQLLTHGITIISFTKYLHALLRYVTLVVIGRRQPKQDNTVLSHGR